MPTFVHPILLWGLPLVGVPLLIHLINLFRHRRVEWAAMEFLLISQRRNRTRVLLRQLLLLLLRMAAIAVIVLMLAEPRVRGGWGRLLGGGTVHHVILLDDSYSMNDRWGDTTGFDTAKVVAAEIAARARREGGRPLLSLLRFSKAEVGERGGEPDFLEVSLDDEVMTRFRGKLETLAHSQTAAGPSETLATLADLLEESRADQHVVYVVSDFRRGDWSQSGDRTAALDRIREHGARLHFIDCVDGERPNLSIAGLRTVSGIRAAGVPITMEVEVVNQGDAPVENTALFVSADDTALSPVAIDRIEPGDSTRRRFTVSLTSGRHVVTARLEEDVLEDDNAAFAVIDVEEQVAVLLVDGDPRGTNAKYIGAALAPIGQVKTGVRVQTRTPRELASQPLEPFQTIYLLDVDPLEQAAIDALGQFVRAGGGLCIFLGPNSDVAHINKGWCDSSQGFFPGRLAGQDVLAPDPLRKGPDLEVEPHPIFEVFAADGGSFLSTVAVQRYFAFIDPESASKTAHVIASLRNGAPLILEDDYGQGRVVTVLTTAAPEWNNWARGNPSFVVCMLELQSYLAARGLSDRRIVGEPLDLYFEAGRFEPRVRIHCPTETAAAAAFDLDARRIEDLRMRATLDETTRSGVYRVELTTPDGSKTFRPVAVNVDATEGNLARIEGASLAAQIPDGACEFHRAFEFEPQSEGLFERKMAGALLQGLVLLLLIEQAVAYWTGYHTRPAASGAERQGGRR